MKLVKDEAWRRKGDHKDAKEAYICVYIYMCVCVCVCVCVYI